MESSVSKAFLHEYNITENISKVIWQATKEDTRQGVYNPWSFADSMAIDQENEVIYWSGRAPGRNGPTTFYRFSIKMKKAHSQPSWSMLRFQQAAKSDNLLSIRGSSMCPLLGKAYGSSL